MSNDKDVVVQDVHSPPEISGGQISSAPQFSDSDVISLDALPGALLTVLERGYLDYFDPHHWIMTPADQAPQRVALKEITRLGRHHADSGYDRGLSSILLSCAAPGHALVSVMHGDADRQRLYVGVRRLPGASISTTDHLSHVTSAFQSSYPGMSFSDEISERLSSDLDDYACFSTITGIPSLTEGSSILPTLEPVLRSVRGTRFQVRVVAEPLDRRMLDQALNGLRRIRSEIHTLVRRTESSGQTVSQGGGQSQNSSAQKLNPAQISTSGLFSLSAALHLAAAVPALAGLGAVAGPIQALAYVAGSFAHRQAGSEGEQSNWGRSTQTNSSRERLDAVAEACEQIVSQHLKRLERAVGDGFWRVAVYIAASNEHELRRVEGALRGSLTGKASHLDPLRSIAPDPDLVRDCMRFGRMISLKPIFAGPEAPGLATAFDQLATCMASHEAAQLFALPENELPGLTLRERAAFSLTAPTSDNESLIVGRVQDQDGRLLAPLPIRASTLNRNALVVGLVGSGKTTTCQRLLTSAYENLKVPFLVVEPVKTEYKEMAAHPALSSQLRVFSAGLDTRWPLRLNPLEPVPGFPIGRHIDLLKAVFNAAFPVMMTGLSYVLEEALLDVYTERGWSLDDEARSGPGTSHTGLGSKAPLPDLRDLHARIEVVINRKGYGQDVQANFGAALRSRLNSLLVGQKAVLFDTRTSTPASFLFRDPAIVELHRLGDDDEKAFAIALLFVLLCEYVEVRQADPTSRRGKLQHLTLIEEAHRLLAAPRGAAGSDAGDARGKAVRMFTDLLAELRAYGEGFIVADQIPTKLAGDVLKNTALKITHRLTSPDDRQAIGGASNLSADQTRTINLLQPGEAIIHDADLGEAICAKIDPIARSANASEQPTVIERPDWLRYGGGCEACAEPCRWRAEIGRSGFALEVNACLDQFVLKLLNGEEPDIDNIFLSTEQPTGRVFCAALQSLRNQIGALLRLRHEALGGQGLRAEDYAMVEHLLALLGPSVARWLRGDGVSSDEWRSIGAKIATVIEAKPPRRRRGCEICPFPCQGLTTAATELARISQAMIPRERLRASIEGPAAAPLRAGAFVTEWNKLAGPSGNPRATGYCAAVLLSGDRAAKPVREVLEILAGEDGFVTS